VDPELTRIVDQIGELAGPLDFDQLVRRARHRQHRAVYAAVGVTGLVGVTAGLAVSHSGAPQTLRVVTPASSSPPLPSRHVFPTVRSGQACPATSGRAVSNSSFGGFELGRGPVRMLIANVGDLRRGIVDISSADEGNRLGTGPAGFYAFQGFWYSLPSYQASWTVTAQRLDGAGRVLFGDSDPTAVAQPVPAGTDQQFGSDYRSGIGSTWVSAPGCYGFQVSGAGLTETVIVDVRFR
jgi:hypothetical protein